MTTLKEQTAEAREALVYEELGRCLIYLGSTLNAQVRTEALHARLLELLQKQVTTQTPSIALTLKRGGFCLLINPEFFLDELSSTEERCSALRCAESHLFLQHPFRLWAWRRKGYSSDQLRLFQLCAALESAQLTSGHVTLPGQPLLTAEHKLPAGASAESLFELLTPAWRALAQGSEAGSEEPTPASDAQGALLASLADWRSRRSPGDQTLWLSPDLEDHHVHLLRGALDQLLIQARETLSLSQKRGLQGTPEGRAVGRACRRQAIQMSPAERFDEVEAELGRILVRMTMKDPFYAQFISGCVRQVSNQVPTAGVGFQEGCVVLYVNPDFFMKTLRSLEERAAVLKHEALHVVLKHIFQVQRPEVTDKQLYNIAADLEVNQYIGHPWRLPSGAVTLAQLSGLNLPEHDVAETYYRLLSERREEPEAADQLQALLGEGLNSGRGHSDHRGWGSSSGLSDEWGEADEASLDAGEGDGGEGDGGEARDRAPANLTGVPQALNPISAEAFELEVERQVQQSVARLSAKERGAVPGRVLQLLEEWRAKRAAQVDWRRALRVFVKASAHYDRQRTHRKTNKRYVRRLKHQLSAERLTADALLLIATTQPERMPEVPWSRLSEAHWALVHAVYPGQREAVSAQLSAPLSWTALGLRALHHLYSDLFDELTWPSWADLTDRQLLSLKVKRTPLDPSRLPVDVWVSLAKEEPQLLPSFSWDLLPSHELATLKTIHPTLAQRSSPAWGVIPNEVIISCIQHRPELFNLSWEGLPEPFIAQLRGYELARGEVFKLERLVIKALPGAKRTPRKRKLLVIIDTSGSVGDEELDLLFTEIDQLSKRDAEVHILQVDTKVQLYYPYSGEVSIAGRGGTAFDPAIEWLNDARYGVDTPTLDAASQAKARRRVREVFDGALYLTDGDAPTPSISPYCRLMWVLTPDGTDSHVKGWAHSAQVIKLSPHPNP